MLSPANSFRYQRHFDEPLPHDNIIVLESSPGDFILTCIGVLGFLLLAFVLFKLCCSSKPEDAKYAAQNYCHCVLQPPYFLILVTTVMLSYVVRIASWNWDWQLVLWTALWFWTSLPSWCKSYKQLGRFSPSSQKRWGYFSILAGGGGHRTN